MIPQLIERSPRLHPEFEWPASLRGECCFVPEWSLLGEHSLYEALSFFAWNIHGERALVAGALHRLDQGDAERRAYLHHFIAEEMAHMQLFGEFCERYGGKIYPDTRFALSAEADPAVADVIFVGQIVTFEEIVDGLNRLHARDARVTPIVRAIHRYHHLDERRHLAFGLDWLRRLVAGHDFDLATRRRIGTDLAAWVRMISTHRVQSEALHDAGCGPDARRRVRERAHEERLRFRELLPRCRRVVAELDLLPAGGELVA